MKRHRVLDMQFDMRANVLGWLKEDAIKDEWPEKTKEMMRQNAIQLRRELVQQYGELELGRKVEDLKAIGPLTMSIIDYHNTFLEQSRDAFVMGHYYPALTSACALGERILNHMILRLRNDFTNTPEYRKVAKNKAFDDWHIMIEVLSTWQVLLPQATTAFKELKGERHRAVHFDPKVDLDVRARALKAILLIQGAVTAQFSPFGGGPWFFLSDGESYVRRAWVAKPFVKRFILPSCKYVGPDHRLGPSDVLGKFLLSDDSPDGNEVSDEEFVKLRKVSLARAQGAPQSA